MLRYLSLLFFMLLPFAGSSQTDAKGRLIIKMKAVENAYDHHPDSLEYYANDALPLARQLNDINAETRIQRLRGAKTYLNGDFDKSVEIYLAMIKKGEKYPPYTELGSIYYELSGVYGKNNYPEVARGYIFKGIAVGQVLNDDKLLADGYNRIGVYYERMGNKDSAFYCYQQALISNQKAGELLGESYSLENIAGIYSQQHQPDKALDYQKKALAYRRKSGDNYSVAVATINIAETFDSLKQYDSAIYYARATIQLARSIGFKDVIRYSYGFLSGIYENKKDYKTALTYHQMYTKLDDSIFDDTKSKQIAELNTKYETAQKEEKIRALDQQTTIQQLQLKQRNFLLVIALGILIMGAIITYLVYNRRKLKEQTRLQSAINKQQEIAARDVIQAEERERRRIAADLHDGVGQMLSAALMNINSLFDKLKVNKEKEPLADKTLALLTDSYDELRLISHQMIPNALIKAGLSSAIKELITHIDQSKLAISLEIIGLNKRMDEEIETVLYRVIQEAINNVIKHAKASKLHIQLVKDTDGITITIEDNGVGFDLKKIKKDGIGLKNMLSRIDFHHGTIDVDSKPGRGTLIAIYIPA